MSDGAFGPAEYLPLPRSLAPSPFPRLIHSVCLGTWLQAANHQKRADKPCYTVRECFSHDREACAQIKSKILEFDAADNVLIVIAHDPSMLEEGVPTFPAMVNNWRSGNLAGRTR